jgi:ribosomal protein S11
MDKQLTAIGIILLLIIVGLSGCFGQATKDFNKEYDADENTILSVININGPITISTGIGNKISLDATMRSNIGESELDNIKIEVTEVKNLIDIETKYLGSGSIQISTDMEINVPNYVIVNSVSSSNGQVRITDAKGNVTAHSSNGDVIIQDVDGYIDVITSNGRVEVKDSTGIKNIRSSNGDIFVEIFDFKENIIISTSNGGISVYINQALNANLMVTTSNGRISITELNLDITSSEEKRIVGKLGVGGNNIEITTSNGNINIYKLNT